MNQSAPPSANGAGVKSADAKTTVSETAQHVGNVTPRSGPAPVKPARQPKLAASDADKWKKHVDSARIVWSKLTEDELLKSDGEAEKLTSLVQERYALSREVAGRRVRSFLDQYKLYQT